MNSSDFPDKKMIDQPSASNDPSLTSGTMLDIVHDRQQSQFKTETAGRQAIFILGMHRAGTSAVTRMVNLLGARLPDNLLGQNESNPQGHWESEDIIALHDDMLRSARSTWHDILDIDPRWFTSVIARDYVRRIRSYIAEKLADAPIFVIKDPRICLVFPLWIEALEQVGIEPRCILPFRNPVEVARSLIKRNAHAMPGGFMPVEHGHLLWLRYVLAAERHSRGLRRTFVSFDHLLADWESEADRMAYQLDFTWPLQDRMTKRDISRFLSHEHKHHNEGDGAALSRLEPVYKHVYAELHHTITTPSTDKSVFNGAYESYLKATYFLDTYIGSALERIASLADENNKNIKDLDRESRGRIEFEERFRLSNVHIDNITEQLASTQRYSDTLKQEIERLSKARDEDLARVERSLRETQARADEAERTQREAQARADEDLARAERSLRETQARADEADRALQDARSAVSYYAREDTQRARQAIDEATVLRDDVRRLAAEAESLLEPEHRSKVAWHEAQLRLEDMVRQRQSILQRPFAPVRSIIHRVTKAGHDVAGPEIGFSAKLITAFEEAHSRSAEHVDARDARQYAERLAIAKEPRAAEAESAAQVLSEQAERSADYAASLIAKSVPAEQPALPKNDYTAWVESYDTITDADRRAIRARLSRLPYKPLISVVMPVYNTPVPLLREALQSVENQLYGNWELCIADDASTDPEIGRVLAEAAERDIRIQIVTRSTNGHICAASNSALELATGEYVALMDHDDILPEHSLFEVVVALNDNRDLDVIYSDEDHIDGLGRRRQPYFKTDYNADLLVAHNLISHLGVYRRSLIEAIGGFRLGYEGSQDYDLALRAIDATSPERIFHIPAILYHWRQSSGEATFSETFMKKCIASAKQAIADHLDRKNEQGRVISHPDLPLWQRVLRPVPDPTPLVSIIVPTRDQPDLLRTCLNGVLNRTDYPNLEVIVIDHDSAQPETHSLFDDLKRDDRVRVVPYSGPFNFSDMNNHAVSMATGSILALLNNDVDIINPEWLSEMVSLAAISSVGAVGAKLIYPDERVQHGGVVLGVGGVANHFFHLLPRDDKGPIGRAVLTSTVSAVTAACLVVRKSVFDEVGGFDADNLPVAFNDVDLCLKIGQRGYRNVWTPHALLYHHESVSRGSDLVPEKLERFKAEVRFMQEKWGHLLDRDPFYNLNLNIETANFGLSSPPRRTKPWILRG